jgi:hypothetical protein
MQIAVERGIRKPYRAPNTPINAPRRGPRGGWYTQTRTKDGRPYRRYF